MSDATRISVTLVIATPMASEIRRQDVTEFLAACHRHDVPADARITIETKAHGETQYSRLVATKMIEVTG